MLILGLNYDALLEISHLIFKILFSLEDVYTNLFITYIEFLLSDFELPLELIHYGSQRVAS